MFIVIMAIVQTKLESLLNMTVETLLAIVDFTHSLLLNTRRLVIFLSYNKQINKLNYSNNNIDTIRGLEKHQRNLVYNNSHERTKR